MHRLLIRLPSQGNQKHRWAKSVLVFLIVLFIKSWLFPQSIIELNSNNEYLSLGTRITTYRDDSGLLEFTRILSPNIQNEFVKSNQKVPNFGLYDGAIWCKLILKNNTNTEYYLEIGNMALDSITLYYKDENNIIQSKTTGSYENLNKRILKSSKNYFNLGVHSKKEQSYYIRIRHSRGTYFPINLSTLKGFKERYHSVDFYQGIYFGVMIFIILYNLFIYFSVRDKVYVFYILYITLMTLLNSYLTGYGFEHLWPNYGYFNRFEDLFPASTSISGILFTMRFLKTKERSPKFHKLFQLFILNFSIAFLIALTTQSKWSTIIIEFPSLLLMLFIFYNAYGSYKSGYRPAKYFLLAWTVLLISVILFVLIDLGFIEYNYLLAHGLQIGSGLEALLLSFALADRINIYKKEKEEAQISSLNSMRKNRELITNQNIILEQKVNARTAELEKSLKDLKSTQAQLIQSEKMASLGELTAGIAHEIQNPLNFVNNFSEVSGELIDEAIEEIDTDPAEAKDILSDLKTNLEKINHHGKRADSIVKGMLQHSRSGTGDKVPTDINAMCDEYMRLAYHGLRAKNQSFNADYELDLDDQIGTINVVPQDMSRVILNIITNAFQACNEYSMENQDATYAPKVVCSTSLSPLRESEGGITITISDNGGGIPQDVIDKIFQPFFTTKPTGQGTGLGLSMAYDIVKAHGGKLTVESVEGQGSEFRIVLPVLGKQGAEAPWSV